MNYHQKQKQNNSFKSSIKKFNSIIEIDTNINSAYLYVNPFSHKTGHTIDNSEHQHTNKGLIIFDYCEGKLCGIEITEAEKHIDLEGLGIKDNGPQINRGEVDGNR